MTYKVLLSKTNVFYEKLMFYVIKPLNICQNLKEVDQEIQRGPMSIFLIKYLLKA